MMEYRKISELKPYPGNPRKINAEKLQSLMASIDRNKDYFEAKPVILSNRTGELVIIAGNMRAKAAEKLGLTEIPTVVMEGLTEEREKEIILLDNTHHGEWEMDLLQGWDFEAIGIEPPITFEIIETYTGTDEKFVKDFDNIKDKDAKMPMVPEFMEDYNAFIIITKNQIDELYVRNVLKLTEVMGNTCKLKNRLSNVITVEQLKEALKWKERREPK